MERYATKEATAAALVSLGFIRFNDVCFDSPNETETGSPVIQCHIYRCANQYWCVDIDVADSNAGWSAPIVWDGPRADWDKSDPLHEFVERITQANPAWR